jgi:hypothetical protein
MTREGKNIQVGKTGIVENRTVVCEPAICGCDGCFAHYRKCHGAKIGRPVCFANERPDKMSVIFKEVLA